MIMDLINMPKTRPSSQNMPAVPATKNKAGVAAFYPTKLYPSLSPQAVVAGSSLETTGNQSGGSAGPAPATTSITTPQGRSGLKRPTKSALETPDKYSSVRNGSTSTTSPGTSTAIARNEAHPYAVRSRIKGSKPPNEMLNVTPGAAQTRNASASASSQIQTAAPSQPSTSYALDDEAMDVDYVAHVLEFRRGSGVPAGEAKATFVEKKFTRQNEKDIYPAYGIVIVVDTNILMSEIGLDLLKRMSKDPRFHHTVVKIPHRVFTELDGLKAQTDSKRTESVSAARRAITYLHDHILEQDHKGCRVIGQSMDDFRRGRVDAVDETADSDILVCVEQTALSSSLPVYLVTNDKNLQTRHASGNPGSVRSLGQLKTEVEHHVLSKSSIFRGTVGSPASEASSTGQSLVTGRVADGVLVSADSSDGDVMAVDDGLIIQQPPPPDPAFANAYIPLVVARLIIDCTERMATVVLHYLLRNQAEYRFGINWMKALESSPPWTLCDILNLICRFRTGLFLTSISAGDMEVFKRVGDMKAAAEQSFSFLDVFMFHQSVRNLFRFLVEKRQALKLPPTFDQLNEHAEDLNRQLVSIGNGAPMNVPENALATFLQMFPFPS